MKALSPTLKKILPLLFFIWTSQGFVRAQSARHFSDCAAEMIDPRRGPADQSLVTDRSVQRAA